jgi:hypothetical protein
MSLTIPELIHIVFPENSASFVKVQTQFGPDLLFIENYPTWGHIHPKASYVVVDEKQQSLIVKLINDLWYFLMWSARSNMLLHLPEQPSQPVHLETPALVTK